MATISLRGSVPTAYPNIGAELYVKLNFADDWTWIPFVKVIQAECVASPSVGSAQMRYRFGAISRAELLTYYYYLPYFVKGTLCQIVIYSPWEAAKLWFGRIEVESVEPYGSTSFPSGIQTWTAYSIEHDLDRRQMVFSKTEDGWIDRAMTFNERRGRGQSLAGNKANASNVFGADGATWTNLDIVNYIGDNWINFDPHTGLANPIPWALAGETQALAATVEVHNFDGMTPLQALNKLIDHRLGVGWRTFTDGVTGVWLYVYSTLPMPMMYGSAVIPPNMNQGMMVLAGDNTLTPEITFNALTDYDVIVARGGHIASMFSLSYVDTTLVEGWNTTTDETAYGEGSAAVGADAQQHDSERNTDKYRHVYTRHRVVADWDYRAGDGEGGTKYLISPSNDYLGAPNTAVAAQNYRIGQEFLGRLLIEAEGGNADEPEYRRPFAVVNIDTTAGDPIWAYVDKLESVGKAEASVAMGDNELSVLVQGKPVPHVAALGHYDLLSPAAADSGTSPSWDYRTLIATVAMKTDKRLFVSGTVPNRIIREIPRMKLIEDPNAVAWYIAPGTITDVTDGALVKHAGGVLRDDSNRLVVMVARAMAWYGVPRATVGVQVGTITLAWPVGSMVAGIFGPEGYTDVFTVVSRQVWTFDDDGPKTTIETGYMELDHVPKGGE